MSFIVAAVFSAARADGEIEGLKGDEGKIFIEIVLFTSAFLNGVGAAILYVA